MSNLYKLWSLLDRPHKLRGLMLGLTIIIVSILDTLGTLSIVPLISIVFGDTRYLEYSSVNEIIAFFDVDNTNAVTIMGIISLFLFVISLIGKLYSSWYIYNFTYSCERHISTTLLTNYLAWPFNKISTNGASYYSKVILSETNYIINNGILPAINLVTGLSLTFLIVSILIILEPQITLLITFMFVVGYGFSYFFIRSKVFNLGADRNILNEKRFAEISDIFGGIKEVKFFTSERWHVEQFIKNARKFAKLQSQAYTLTAAPRYLIEAVLFLAAIIIAVGISRTNLSAEESIATLSLFVISSLRLLPACQSVFRSLTLFNYGKSSVDLLFDELKSINDAGSEANEVNQTNQNELNNFEKLELLNIDFSYPDMPIKTLLNLSLSITKGEKIAIVGPSGSGKSSLLNILIGITKPCRGQILINGKNSDEFSDRSYKSLIGYVPQDVYLRNGTISSNIAFGQDEPILETIHKVSLKSGLNDFVRDENGNFLDKLIIEKGINLSGGQRQRIGIARALYRLPGLLVLDEATSALDAKLETEILDELINENLDLAIVLVTHREKVLDKFHKVFRMEAGALTPVVQSMDNS